MFNTTQVSGKNIYTYWQPILLFFITYLDSYSYNIVKNDPFGLVTYFKVNLFCWSYRQNSRETCVVYLPSSAHITNQAYH